MLPKKFYEAVSKLSRRKDLRWAFDDEGLRIYDKNNNCYCPVTLVANKTLKEKKYYPVFLMHLAADDLKLNLDFALKVVDASDWGFLTQHSTVLHSLLKAINRPKIEMEMIG